MRVEYADELLSLLQPDSARIETAGFLCGSRDASAIRLVSTSQKGPPADVVGFYILRKRGEVFLTEANTALFGRSDVAVGLVIAGRKAGFFVRGFDGSLQAVSSFEEFSVPHTGSSGSGSTLGNKWAQSKSAMTAALLLAAALPLTALVRLPPRGSASRPGLRIREHGDQLLISWKSGRAGVLEISDGGHRTAARILPQQSAATYVRRYGDVEVTLILLDR